MKLYGAMYFSLNLLSLYNEKNKWEFIMKTGISEVKNSNKDQILLEMRKRLDYNL